MYFHQPAVPADARAGGAGRTSFAVPASSWPDLVPAGVPTFVEDSTQIFKAQLPDARLGDAPIELRLMSTRFAGALGSAWVQWSRLKMSEAASDEDKRPTSFQVYFWNPQDVPPEGMVNGCIGGLETDLDIARRRTWIESAKRLRIRYDIMLPDKRPIRGAILYGASLGPQYELPVIQELLSRGWAVVACSSASISTDRLTGGVIDFQGDGEAAFRAYGKLAAEECDKVLAGYAYGWEVACEMMESYYPEVPARPRVMAGFSFGAIMTPTGVARLGTKVDATVLVGGGTNLFGILAETPAITFPIRVRDLNEIRRATPSELERITSYYIEYSQLDGHITARALRQRPVLMLHAMMDGWVPARFGRDLWEQAGRPERWQGPFGHMLMFYFLGHEAKPIADWVDQTTADIRLHAERP